MGTHRRHSRCAFTLLELLIVLAIIGILVSLAVPAAASLRARACDQTIAREIADLSWALEAYKRDKGDYPPSMGEDYSPGNRFRTICEKHLRICYPKATRQAKNYFYDHIAPELDQDEAIVFWLSLTTLNELDPFPVAVMNGNPVAKSWAAGTSPPCVYYDFREDRLWDTPSDPDAFPGYAAPYCKGKSFVHIDARYYRMHLTPATAAISEVQPYFDADGNPIHPATFQIITAGQDGDYGPLYDAMANPSLLKRFPRGENFGEEDRDNVTDFSDGKRLSAWIP
jgi:prepilin-type N-terminal cleavage/methylation domain-containing protein